MASAKSLVVEAYNSLSKDINKMPGHTSYEYEQGVVSAKLPEISVEMPNETIAKTLKKVEKAWKESDVFAEWVKRGDENVNYWKGKHFARPETDKTRALVDNVIFESLETSIPQYIARNPEPDVDLRPGQPTQIQLGTIDPQTGQPASIPSSTYVDSMQTELGFLGDELKMRLKLKKVARHWALTLLGVAKVGWDVQRDIPMLKVVRPRKVILDPTATIDEDGYTGEFVGEYRELAVHKMLPFLTEPDAKEKVEALVKDDLATKVQFIEWWTDTTLIWMLGDDVLMKRANPHWNYDQSAETLESDFTPVGIAPEGSPAIPQLPTAGDAPDRNAPGRPTLPKVEETDREQAAGEDLADRNLPQAEAAEKPEQESPEEGYVEGQPKAPEEAAVPPTRKGANHFPAPRKPYLFLVMFNLGDQPVDNTSLITQNLANQDIINKRVRQIDKNADNMNNGLVVSLERSGLTSTQAKGVTEALRKGGVVGIPAGSPQDAVWRPATPGLPADVYNNLADVRNRVRGIFGVEGSSPAGLAKESTVRGKIMNRTLDTDRIGGGISEILEQFADDAYNWFVQLKLVYEDKYQQLAAQAPGGLPKVTVSIKAGSLLPKDKVTLANQAIELAGSGHMATVDLYKALEYPNAEELAVNAWLQVNAPDLLYPNDPRVQQALQRQQQAAQAEAQAKAASSADKPKAPSESINFKDLPPDGRVQMAAKVGITLHSEGVAAHEQLSKNGAGGSTAPLSGPGSNAALNAGVSPAQQ